MFNIMFNEMFIIFLDLAVNNLGLQSYTNCYTNKAGRSFAIVFSDNVTSFVKDVKLPMFLST